MFYFLPSRFAFHRWGVSHTCWFVQKGGSSKPGRDTVILSSPKYALRWRMLTSPRGQRSPCSTLTPLTPQPPKLLLRVSLLYEIFKNGVRGRSDSWELMRKKWWGHSDLPCLLTRLKVMIEIHWVQRPHWCVTMMFEWCREIRKITPWSGILDHIGAAVTVKMFFLVCYVSAPRGGFYLCCTTIGMFLLRKRWLITIIYLNLDIPPQALTVWKVCCINKVKYEA